MSAFIGALLFASLTNMCLNGVFLVQLANFCSNPLPSEPVFIRVVVFIFSFFDVSQTAVMAYLALYACFGSHKSPIFVWLYSTIRLWSIPIYVAAYGFYAFQITKLTGLWTIAVLVICLLFVQTGGTIFWTIGTIQGRTAVDLTTGNGMTMAGTVLCAAGALLCSLCIMVSVVITVRNSLVRALPGRRDPLHHLQIVSMRIHIPLIVVTATDLVGYILFKKSHISTVTAIIVGKVWSNTLLYGLNSRQALRRAPSRLDHTMEFGTRRQQRNSSMSDDFTIELPGIGTLASAQFGDTSSFPSLEQDITSARLSEEEKNLGGGVQNCAAIQVRFGEPLTTRRSEGRHERRSSAPT